MSEKFWKMIIVFNLQSSFSVLVIESKVTEYGSGPIGQGDLQCSGLRSLGMTSVDVLLSETTWSCLWPQHHWDLDRRAHVGVKNEPCNAKFHLICKPTSYPKGQNIRKFAFQMSCCMSDNEFCLGFEDASAGHNTLCDWSMRRASSFLLIGCAIILKAVNARHHLQVSNCTSPSHGNLNQPIQFFAVILGCLRKAAAIDMRA